MITNAEALTALLRQSWVDRERLQSEADKKDAQIVELTDQLSRRTANLTFDELCTAVRMYVETIPTEGGRGNRDSWRCRLDNTLADIRVELSSCYDDPEDA